MLQELAVCCQQIWLSLIPKLGGSWNETVFVL